MHQSLHCLTNCFWFILSGATIHRINWAKQTKNVIFPVFFLFVLQQSNVSHHFLFLLIFIVLFIYILSVVLLYFFFFFSFYVFICRLNLLRASVFNFERLDILRDSIRHPSKKLLSFEFAQSFCFKLRAFRYITGINRTSELKVIVVGLFLELPFWISSVSIYYRAPSNIRVKSYCRLNYLKLSIYI